LEAPAQHLRLNVAHDLISAPAEFTEGLPVCAALHARNHLTRLFSAHTGAADDILIRRGTRKRLRCVVKAPDLPIALPGMSRHQVVACLFGRHARTADQTTDRQEMLLVEFTPDVVALAGEQAF